MIGPTSPIFPVIGRPILRTNSVDDRALFRGIFAISIVGIVCQNIGVDAFRSGYTGVDVALVAIGFVVGRHVDGALQRGNFSLPRFYLLCCQHVLLPTMLVVLATCAACFFLMSARELQLTGASGAAALLGTSNIFFWWASKYASAILHVTPLLMTWAVSLVLQFCGFFPLLLLAMRRWRRGAVLATILILVVLSFAACVAVTPYRPTTAFYLPHLRAWQLLAGALVAMILTDRTRLSSAGFAEASGWLGLAMVLASFHLFPDGARYPGSAALLPVCGTLGLLLDQRGIVREKLLKSFPIQCLGAVSFSLYLWHAPILRIVDIVAFGTPNSSQLAIAALIAAPIAVVAWAVVERLRPTAQPKPNSPAGDIPSLAGFVSAAMVSALIPTAFYLWHGLPERLGPTAAAVEQAIVDGRSNPCIVPYGTTTASSDDRCDQDGASPVKVALIGDSHAAALGPGFVKLAAKDNVGLVQIEKSACLPVLDPIVPAGFETQHDEQCAAFNKATFDRIAADRQIKTVVMTGFWSGSFLNGDNETREAGLFRRDPALADEERLKASLTRTLQRYRDEGKEVVVLGDIPLFRFDPGQDAVSDAIPLRAQLRDMIGKPDSADGGIAPVGWVRREDTAERAVAQSASAVPGTLYVPLRQLMCDKGNCRFADARGSFYIDFHHLSRQGALYVAERLGL